MVASGDTMVAAERQISPTLAVKRRRSLLPRSRLFPWISREVMSTYFVRWNWRRYSVRAGWLLIRSFRLSLESR